MEGFTIIDGVVAVIIVLSALLAYSRGLVREALAIAGWIVAAILAFIFAAQVQPLIKESRWWANSSSDSCELSIIAAFAAVFAVALVIMSLFTPLFSSLCSGRRSAGWTRRWASSSAWCAASCSWRSAFFVYDTVMTAQDIAMVDEARLGQGVRALDRPDRGAEPRGRRWAGSPPSTKSSSETCDAPAGNDT